MTSIIFGRGVGGGLLTTTKKLRLEVHVIERVDGLVIVGLDLSCGKRTVSICAYPRRSNSLTWTEQS